MQTQQEQRRQQEMIIEIAKRKIAVLRANYARLRAICGPRGIDRETVQGYANEIASLQEQIN